MGINTDLLHGYPVVDPFTGAASIPKYQTSTFNQTCLNGEKKEFSYTRFGNPTVTALEEAYIHMTHSKYALAYGSGMAAISNILMLLKAGDHIILPKEVYGGTFQFATSILPEYEIEVSFIDMSSTNNIKKHIKNNTRMIYVETPSNPLLKVTDIRSIVALTKESAIITVADNTFMTSLYQKPLEMGIDIVVESATKFINGHSDVVGGLVATNNEKISDKLRLYQKNFGGIIGVEDAWLILRGMKTMGIRMERSVENAKQIANFLINQEKIAAVYYPGLVHHPLAKIHKQQAENGGAVLSFVLKNNDDLDTLLNK